MAKERSQPCFTILPQPFFWILTICINAELCPPWNGRKAIMNQGLSFKVYTTQSTKLSNYALNQMVIISESDPYFYLKHCHFKYSFTQ